MAATNLKDALDAISDLVVLVDEESGECMYANAVADRMLGGPLKGRSLGTYLLSDDAFDAEVPTSEGTLRLEARVTHSLWDGRPARALVLRDVTRLREQEDALRHLEVMKAVGVIAASATHDLRNIAGVAIGTLDLALLDCNQPEVAEQMRFAQEVIDSGLAQFDGLLGIARYKSSDAREDVDVHEFVKSNLPLFRHAAPRAQLHFEPTIGGGVKVRADRDGLLSAMINLVTNAGHAADADSADDTARVRIALHAVETEVTIEVLDNGPGFGALDQERLVEPFFTTKPAGVGTGLGLSSVHAYVLEMGGSLHLGDTDIGARVAIVLPRVAAD